MTCEVITINGKRRKLGLTTNPAGLVSSMPVFSDNLLLDMSDIIAIAKRADHGRSAFGASWICDQGQYGSCAGWAGAKADEATRVERGLKRVKLSGAYLYSRTNGGRDNGSMLEDGQAALAKYGCATEATVPKSAIYRNRYDTRKADAEAAKYKAFEPQLLPTVHHLLSAAARRFICVVAIHAGSKYDRQNSKGVSGVDNGSGNHAVRVDGLAFIGGEITYDQPGSWTTRWGQNGRTYLTERHFEQTINNHSFYCLRSTTDGGDSPPAVR